MSGGAQPYARMRRRDGASSCGTALLRSRTPSFLWEHATHRRWHLSVRIRHPHFRQCRHFLTRLESLMPIADPLASDGSGTPNSRLFRKQTLCHGTGRADRHLHQPVAQRRSTQRMYMVDGILRAQDGRIRGRPPQQIPPHGARNRRPQLGQLCHHGTISVMQRETCQTGTTANDVSSAGPVGGLTWFGAGRMACRARVIPGEGGGGRFRIPRSADEGCAGSCRGCAPPPCDCHP